MDTAVRIQHAKRSSTSWGWQQKPKSSASSGGTGTEAQTVQLRKKHQLASSRARICATWLVTSAGWLCCRSDSGDLWVAGVSPQPSRWQSVEPFQAAGMNSHPDTTLKARGIWSSTSLTWVTFVGTWTLWFRSLRRVLQVTPAGRKPVSISCGPSSRGVCPHAVTPVSREQMSLNQAFPDCLFSSITAPFLPHFCLPSCVPASEFENSVCHASQVVATVRQGT